MKKTFVIASLLLFCDLLNAQVSLKALQMYFPDSVNSEKAAKYFFNETQTIKENAAPVLLGYKAMSYFMMCNYSSDPLTKLGYFNEGKKLLGNAIEKESKNPELIYFRFSTQLNTPKILNYKNELNTDKAFLLEYLENNSSPSNSNKTLNSRIKEILIQSKLCSKDEIHKMND